MLRKLLFFGAQKVKPSLSSQKDTASAEAEALRIIHAGGRSERCYMAVPASRIMEKYHPSFALARPDFFRRPWDSGSVVKPEEMLIPGHKFLVVPMRTMKKLRRRIKKRQQQPIREKPNKIVPQQQQFSTHFGGLSSKSSNRRVRFSEMDTKQQENCKESLLISSSSTEKEEEEEMSWKKTRNRKIRLRHSVKWQPSLAVIMDEEACCCPCPMIHGDSLLK